MSETDALQMAKAWASNTYFDEESRNEIKNLIDKNETAEIVERFYKTLEIGTGGIRGILGQGINRINKYTIRKASQALASEVKKLPADEHRIAISFDSRRFSPEFAREAAGVFAANGIHSYIYQRLNPVPLLSWSVRYHKCHAGVMVTASHNPPEYNGYKIYWSDGAQVTPPYDQNVINAYNSIEVFDSIKYMPFETAEKEGFIHWVGEDVEDAYFAKLRETIVNPDLCRDRGSELKIVFTPIHGTALIPCTRALNELGMTNYAVPESQAKPDWKFPTVKSPNPENPEALAIAVEQMKETNADIVMGTDPDTDRLGVAVMHQGEVFYPNGNQIGLLMLHYILTNLKEQGRLPERPYFVKTIVTSELLAKVAASFGVEVYNTLTGFKWICGLMNVIEEKDPKKKLVFATEESFGYMTHNFVRDKDGICSVACMAELALWYKTQGMTLVDALDKIYEEYGFSHDTLLNLNYLGKEGAEKIARIMDKFRSEITTEFAGLEVEERADYLEGHTKTMKNGNTVLLDLPKSNVLGYIMSSGDRVFLRPSGTEPKIKFYIGVNETEGILQQKKARAREKTEKILSFIKRLAEEA